MSVHVAIIRSSAINDLLKSKHVLNNQHYPETNSGKIALPISECYKDFIFSPKRLNCYEFDHGYGDTNP